MVRQSRRLRRSPSRLDTRRDSSGTVTILAFDSHDCSPKKSAKSVARRTSMSELTHPIPLLPQRQSRFRPLLEMPRRIDRAARVPLRPNRPVLRERRCAEYRGGVDAPFAPDFVGAAVGVEGAVAGVVAVVGGVVLVAKVLDHVVFDEWVCCPAVEAEVGVAGCGEGAGVVEEPGDREGGC